MRIQITKSLCALLIISMVGACRPRQIKEPYPTCPGVHPKSLPSLCVVAVSILLGPADGIEGYEPITGLEILMLPSESVELPEDIKLPPDEFILTGRYRDMAGSLVDTSKTDIKGSAFLSTEPGTKYVCVIGNSLVEVAEKVVHCEEVTIDNGSMTRLLVKHGPWGDIISFSWPE